MKKTIFITGATAGFGEAIAQVFAHNGWRLIIAARRVEKLNALKEKFENEYQSEVWVLPLDVRNRKQVFDAVSKMPEQWQQVDVLVNNAGLALGREPFEDGDVDDWEIMIDTNLKGLLYVSKAVVPLMIRANAGHIINIGSTAGKEVYKDGNVYCATKFAVDAIGRAQRIDLLNYNIKVTNINPGAAQTEFSAVRFKGDESRAAGVYTGYQPLTAMDVANIVYYCASLPPHVCINALDVTCLAQAGAHYLRRDV